MENTLSTSCERKRRIHREIRRHNEGVHPGSEWKYPAAVMWVQRSEKRVRERSGFIARRCTHSGGKT